MFLVGFCHFGLDDRVGKASALGMAWRRTIEQRGIGRQQGEPDPSRGIA